MRKKGLALLALVLVLAGICMAALADTVYCLTCYGEMKLVRVIKEPYCETKGSREYVCDKGHKQTVSVRALGHAWTRLQAEFPTCTQAGWQDVRCDRCGAQERQVLKMKSHWYETPWTYTDNGMHSSDCRYGCGTRDTERCTMWLYALDGEGACSGICLVCGHQETWSSLADARSAYPQARCLDAEDVYAELSGACSGFTKTRSCEGYLKLEAGVLRDRFNLYVGSGNAKNVLACVVHALPEGVSLDAGEGVTRTDALMEGGRGSTVYGEGVGAIVQLADGTQAALLVNEVSSLPQNLPSGLYVTLPVQAAGAGENTITLNLDLSKARTLSDIQALLVVFPAGMQGWNEKK